MATVALKTNPVIWFEIPVKDSVRARTFYEKVFGLELTPEEMGPYMMTFFPWTEGAPGAAGTLIKGETYEPSHAGTVVYFTVGDIEENFFLSLLSIDIISMPPILIITYTILWSLKSTGSVLRTLPKHGFQ